jgi:hypothetical protein
MSAGSLSSASFDFTLESKELISSPSRKLFKSYDLKRASVWGDKLRPIIRMDDIGYRRDISTVPAPGLGDNLNFCIAAFILQIFSEP